MIMMQIKLLMNSLSLSHFVQDTNKTQENQTRVSDSIFDTVQLLCYKCHNVNCKLGGSYIDSPDWIKK